MDSALSVVRSWFESAIELVAPSRCAACDAWDVAPGAPFCVRCEPAFPAPVVTTLACGLAVVAVSAYEGPLRDAVHTLKYGKRPDLARPLGDRVARVVRRFLPRADVLVPVPLHAGRLADRGYNQAALIANRAGRTLSVRVATRGLARLRETRTQASLGKRERLENASGAFVAREPFEGLHVVVVDDVVTTGATAVSAAAALLLAGARTVSIAAVLRADTRAPDRRGSLP